jgi:hypothetical protein
MGQTGLVNEPNRPNRRLAGSLTGVLPWRKKRSPKFVAIRDIGSHFLAMDLISSH